MSFMSGLLVFTLGPPRPSSTLFPYTTLFRSDSAGRGATLPWRFGVHLLPQTDDFVHLFAEVDRKSTRLNSSHRCISYAVFCLKKKTRRRGHPRQQHTRRPRGGVRLARLHPGR